MQAVPLRLHPGDDLRAVLEAIARDGAARSGFVLAGIGSLDHAAIRYAGVDAPTILAEPLELIALSGTLGPDGAHLHATVSTASGRVVGGHVSPGCRIRTTAEILVAWLPEVTLRRVIDPVTGHPELQVGRYPERGGSNAAAGPVQDR